ncbi:MAG TPA: DUF3140 domain-containing protein [Sphingomicrobium sp.]|nr:DUF3140 domain-containing protein [Sphingomicrobium sp.]
MAKLDRKQIRRLFDETVNMTAGEIEAWLRTPESKKVGFRKGGKGESVGHGSGRRIVAILSSRAVDLTDDDYAHMRKVVGFVKRHGVQRPQNIYTSRWRYSLMNWGHDPVKEDR